MAMKRICSCGKVILDTETCECKQKKQAERKQQQSDKAKAAAKFLQSKRWRKLRIHIIKRDDGYCQRCFIKYQLIVSTNLEAHHIKSREHYPELAWDENNLICVCKSCNNQLGIKDELDFPFEIKNEETQYLF